MKYLIRAVKYYVQLMVILTLIIVVLIVAKVVDSDVSQIFVNGYDSLWQIALMMAAFAALYPKLGYGRREAVVPGADEEVLPLLDRVMSAHGYAREQRADGKLCYRKTSFGDRLMRLWEDRITVGRLATGFELEGLNRDAVRLVNALRDASRG
ncbi:MAG: hypothetical protein IKZ91_04655 [Bacteroidales bacterium]|nr:hypothetical protein [Bacteroidales bacterium]